jgi:hypothetical protein
MRYLNGWKKPSCHCVLEWMFSTSVSVAKRPRLYICHKVVSGLQSTMQFQVATTDFAMAIPCNNWRASWANDWQDYRDWRSFYQKSHDAESLLNWYMGEMSSLRRKPIMSSAALKNRLVWINRIVCACDHSPDVIAYNEEQKRKRACRRQEKV